MCAKILKEWFERKSGFTYTFTLLITGGTNDHFFMVHGLDAVSGY